MKTLLVLVPGYDAAAARNDALNCLKDGIASIHDDSISSQATRGNSSGWIVTRGADSVEMYEAFWQDQIQMLSDSKPYIRVLNGLWMSLLWLNPRTILILRHSFMWLLATIGGAFLLTLWLYGAVAVLLVSLGNLIPNGDKPANAVERPDRRSQVPRILRWQRWCPDATVLAVGMGFGPRGDCGNPPRLVRKPA